MNNKKPLPNIVIFAGITTITAFVWIGFEIIRTYNKKPEPSVNSKIIEQLDPALDITTLTNIVQRIHLEDSEIGDISTINKEANEKETTLETKTEKEGAPEITETESFEQ